MAWIVKRAQKGRNRPIRLRRCSLHKDRHLFPLTRKKLRNIYKTFSAAKATSVAWLTMLSWCRKLVPPPGSNGGKFLVMINNPDRRRNRIFRLGLFFCVCVQILHFCPHHDENFVFWNGVWPTRPMNCHRRLVSDTALKEPEARHRKRLCDHTHKGTVVSTVAVSRTNHY